MGDLLSREGRERKARAARPGALSAVCAGAAVVLVACASVLGIEDRPLRADTDGAPLVDGGGGGGADVGAEASCNLFESRACSADCPRDFCDDFDGDGQAPESRWVTPIGLQNPFVRGDSGVALTMPADSPPYALSTRTSSSSTSSYGMLAHLLSFDAKHKGQTFDGVRVAFKFRIDELKSTGIGGPVKDAGSAAMLGMLRADVVQPLKGIAVVLSGRSMILDVADDVLGGDGSNVLGTVATDLDLTFLRDNWVQLELFVGDRERATQLGFALCATTNPGLVAAAGLAGRTLGSACVNVPASFGTPDWAEFPVILAGSLLFSAGTASFRSTMCRPTST